MTVENKYGKIESESLAYYSKFEHDKFGAFYAMGVIMDDLVDMLDSIQILGISLWMFLCTSFVITIIIPLICIIVIPSGAVFSTRGGNHYGKREERDASSAKKESRWEVVYRNKHSGDIIKRRNK